MTTPRSDDRPVAPDAPDTGEPDARLLAALAAGEPGPVREALLLARLLVPVVATRSSDGAAMAVPGLVGHDGRQALPAFSGSAALTAWRADARPVPMAGSQAVTAAADGGYAALLLDVAGPHPHVVAGDDLRVLAEAVRVLGDRAGATVRVVPD